MSSSIENDLLRINNQLCEFSWDGRYFAFAYQGNLMVKSSKKSETVYSFLFPETIEYIEWSRNSEYILCANIKKAVLQLYSLNYPEWKFKLTEGSAGLESITWSPDSRYLLTLSDFNIQISIWSLENQSVSHIQNVKSCYSKLHFSPDGKQLAVIISEEGMDHIEIYKTETWKLDKKLICGRLDHIDGISWSPNSELLCIWSSFSNEAKLLIYSNLLERDINMFCSSKITSSPEILDTYCNALNGIQNVKWMPSGQLLVIISFNQMIILLNHITWKPLLQLYLEPVIKENYLNKVYEERIIQSKHSNKTTSCHDKHVLEETSERPINIKIGKTDDINRLSIAKFKIVEFSYCGQYLTLKHELYPTTLWIWNIVDDYLDYLILESNIVAAKWNPARVQLFVYCECAYMFEWTPQHANCISTPRNITVVDGRWNPQGNLLLLCGYNKAVVYQVDDNS